MGQPANSNDGRGHEELEGWKDIGAALDVSTRTAKRLGRGETGYAPIPTYRNLRGHRAIRRCDLERWKQDALDSAAEPVSECRPVVKAEPDAPATIAPPSVRAA